MDSNDSSLPALRRPALSDAILVGVGMITLLVLVLKNAWLSDDAMITFRTVMNAANGYGLTWNVDERVQAYTHPLWMLLLTGSYLITHEIFFTCVAVSLLCVAGAFLLISLGATRSQAGLLAASAGLILAKSFIDFSTSGLENPLSYLLIAAFCVSYLNPAPGRLWLTALWCGLLAVNRMDLLIVVGPALLVASLSPVWPEVRARLAAAHSLPARLHALLGLVPVRTLGAVLIGMLPLLAWEIFSLIYYGFLLPNTAYAKLNTGIAQDELFRQGVIYLLNSARNDPVTLVTIGVGSLAPLFSRHWRSLALSLGVWLYVIYILRIGGDFMSGRFFTAPLTVAAALIAADMPARPGYLLACVLAALGLLNPQGPLAATTIDDASTTAETNITSRGLQGIVDERAFYFSYRSLGAFGRDPASSDDHFLVAGRRAASQVVSVNNIIGMYGMTVGPGTHIVDSLALSEPLLARLPAAYNPTWRIGHFWRAVPAGYVETLERGVNCIEDPDLAAYYDKLHLIISGPIMAPERWVAIWGMLTGAYDHLIDVDRYRYPDQQRLSYADVSSRQNQQDPYFFIPASGALITFDQAQAVSQIELAFSQEQRIRLQFLQAGQVIYQADLTSSANPLRSLDLRSITLPASAPNYDQIRLLPLQTGDLYLGSLRLIGADDQPAPQIRLGSGWYQPLKTPDLLVLAPASIFVTASKAQPYWLSLTPSMIYEPEAAGGYGTRGTLIVQTSAGYTTTVDIEAGKPASVRLDLPGGAQRIDLSLAAGSYHPPRAAGDGSPDFSFSLSAIHLATLDEIAPLPDDLVINGQAQRAEPEQLIALFGDGWYPHEDTAGVRWAGPAARIDIYSPVAQSAQIKLALRYISDGNGPSGGGVLTVVTNGQPAAPAEAWTWQPFVAPVALQPGWNTLDLSLAAPAFREPVADPTRTEPRMLSFSVEAVEILTQN